MFDVTTCKRCGTCLEQCPILRLPIESAKEEINRMIETKSSQKITQNCINCFYCNIVCPTESNPYDLIREIKLKNYDENGVRSLGVIDKDNPHNLMSLALEIDKEEKQLILDEFENPPKGKKMFYVGCGLPSCFPELTKTKLLEELPVIGGIKYCCGAHVYSYFGEKEARIKGSELYKKFKTLGIEKLITFCPGCDTMVRGIYPSIIEDQEYNIEAQTIIEYLVEKYHKGMLEIKNKIKQRITFQDPCPWRKLDKTIYESPRELLEIIGAEVAEMKHHKENSLCCGLAITRLNRPLATKIQKERISEAESVNADIIAHICSGCYSALSKFATEKNIKSYYITELVQLAIGETVTSNILESTEKINKHILKTMITNPKLLTNKYKIKDGKILILN